jgi:regulator of sirC expression with transglutaminase-like and TPR domain
VHEPRGNIRTSFASLVARRSADVPLAEGALLIAAEEYSGLDVGAYLARLDNLADDVREVVDNAGTPRLAGNALMHFLYEVECYHGNVDDYQDPRNSFLNDVIERRRGIPITLSIVYLELARRLGLTAHGVGLPGHFLVALPNADTYVDPFSGQVDLGEADCARRVHRLHGDQVTFDRSMLEPQSNRQILTRVLRNLREIYQSRGDSPRALAALDRMVLINPAASELYRERARLLGRLGEYQRALRDVEILRKLQPGVRRSERFRTWRRFVRQMAARMN